MPSLADLIEAHIRDLLEAARGELEVQRNALAETFGCAPSQITYVLDTRFTPERGYVVKSRRGGGGYIRIERVRLDDPGAVVGMLRYLIGEQVSQEGAENLIFRLLEEGFCNQREAALLRAAVHRDTIGLPLPVRDQVRARLLRQMTYALFG